MKFSLTDLFLGTLCAVVILLAALAFTYAGGGLGFVPENWDPVFRIFLFVLSFFLVSMLVLWVIRRICPLEEGIFPLDSGRIATVWKLQGFLYVFNLGLFINSYLVPVNMRGLVFSMLGSKIGRNVMIGGKILDPTLVEIGDFTILGEDTLITAHAKERNRVDLGRIVIGSEVTVGVKAVVLPGAEIGDHAIVAAGAVVTKGTRIPPGEIWGGIPAKKIGVIQ